MRRSFRLIAIDLHGYGGTPMPLAPEAFGLQHEVQLVDSVLRVGLLPGERFHLVGHSYGAAVAMQWAQARQQRLQSLTLFEPVAFHVLSPDHPGRLAFEAVRDSVQRHVDGGDVLSAAQHFIDYWSGPGSFDQLPPKVQLALIKQVPKTLLDFAAVSRERSCADDYRSIDVPTCLLSGTLGPSPPHAVLDRLAQVLPQARRQWVIGGHMAPVTHSDLVNPVIDCFIRGVDSGDVPTAARSGARSVAARHG